jgi:hypothetical protein
MFCITIFHSTMCLDLAMCMIDWENLYEGYPCLLCEMYTPHDEVVLLRAFAGRYKRCTQCRFCKTKWLHGFETECSRKNYVMILDRTPPAEAAFFQGLIDSMGN